MPCVIVLVVNSYKVYDKVPVQYVLLCTVVRVVYSDNLNKENVSVYNQCVALCIVYSDDVYDEICVKCVHSCIVENVKTAMRYVMNEIRFTVYCREQMDMLCVAMSGMMKVMCTVYSRICSYMSSVPVACVTKIAFVVYNRA